MGTYNTLLPVTSHSPFLGLPTEVRLNIYSYILEEPNAITITAAPTTVFGHQIKDRGRKVDVPGLPLGLVPLVKSHYEASLLSVLNPPEIVIDSELTRGFEEHKLPYPTTLALLQTCSLVRDELEDCLRMKKIVRGNRSSAGTSDANEKKQRAKAEKEIDDEFGLTLYVSYPYGILVLQELYPFLVKQASRVFVSGYHTSSRAEICEAPLLSPNELSLPMASLVTVSSSLTTPTSHPQAQQTRLQCTGLQTLGPTTEPRRQRFNPSIRIPQIHCAAKAYIYSQFPRLELSDQTHVLAALTSIIRTLLPPNPTNNLKHFAARIFYPGDNSYSMVWADEHSPISKILCHTAGGDISMQVKRGGAGSVVLMDTRPSPTSRYMKTGLAEVRAMPRRNRRNNIGRDNGIEWVEHVLTVLRENGFKGYQ